MLAKVDRTQPSESFHLSYVYRVESPERQTDETSENFRVFRIILISLSLPHPGIIISRPLTQRNNHTMDFLERITRDLPEGFPKVIALNILVSGLSESEVRQIFVDDDDQFPPSKVDGWLAELRAKDWFPSSSTDNVGVLTREFNAVSADSKEKIGKEGGSYLWEELMRELSQDESDFKHRIAVFDTLVKQGMADLSWIGTCEAKEVFPFNEEINVNYPWNGCKCVASAVMLLVSRPNTASKIEAVRPVSRSLGGLEIPNPKDLEVVRNPFILSKTLSPAYKKAQEEGVCTALLVNTTDVEIMRNPGTLFKSRPGTYAHCFVLAVSPEGVFILHSYGPRGYTLLQHMSSHSSKYPLSFKEAEEWTKTFEIYAADRGGAWTKEVNQAYRHCFGVDLVELGTMRIGSQLDAYTTVSSLEFDASMVQKNFDLLPRKRCGGRKVSCHDGKNATATKPHHEYIPDGGVKHYYTPKILRCGYCGKMQSANKGSAHKRCAQCKAIHYCCHEHQVNDWRNHKKICKTIASRHTEK